MMRTKKSTALDYDRLYNKELKIAFIDQYESEETKLTAYWQLLKISEAEEYGEHALQKDISLMNFEEIDSLMRELEMTTITSAINHMNTYKRYCQFTELSKDNPFTKYFTELNKYAEEVVANKYNMRYTREELMFMIDELVNPSDQALLLALFEGIKGKYFSEILTLKSSNLFVREENGQEIYIAKVYDEDTQKYREVNISSDLYKILLQADKEMEYYSNEVDDVKTQLHESEFILKKAKKGKQTNSPLDRHFITRKFLFFKKHFGNSNLTADDIFQSGMLHMAHELFLESGKIGKDELLTIGEQYNTVMASTEGAKPYRNTTVLKRIIFTDSLGLLYNDLRGVSYHK